MIRNMIFSLTWMESILFWTPDVQAFTTKYQAKSAGKQLPCQSHQDGTSNAMIIHSEVTSRSKAGSCRVGDDLGFSAFP